MCNNEGKYRTVYTQSKSTPDIVFFRKGRAKNKLVFFDAPLNGFSNSEIVKTTIKNETVKNPSSKNQIPKTDFCIRKHRKPL